LGKELPFHFIHFPFAVKGDAVVVRREFVVAGESGVYAHEGMHKILDVRAMVAAVGIIVGGKPKEDRSVAGPVEDLAGPRFHEVLIEFWKADRGIIHHWGDEVAAFCDFAKVGFSPVDFGERMPSRGRGISGDGKNFSLREGGIEFVEELEEIGVTAGERFDIDLNSGEAGVVFKKGDRGRNEIFSPACGLGGAVILQDSADPGDDLEFRCVIQESLNLQWIDLVNSTVGKTGA